MTLTRRLCVAEVEPFCVYELAAACDDQAYAAVLENPGEPSQLGRWAYFCCDPWWVFRSKRQRCWAGPPGAEQALAGEPLDELGRLLARVRGDRATWRPGLPPFVGGAVGYLGYELLYLIEDVPDRGRDDLALPDMCLILCDLVFAVDLIEGRGFILATGRAESSAAAEAAAAERLAQGWQLHARLASAPSQAETRADIRARAAAERARRPRLHTSHLSERGIEATIPRSGYLASIEHIQDEILAGNVFEVCLTQRFDVSSEVPSSGRALYEVLRVVNPAPMSAYLRLPEAELLSASPERFVSLDREGVVETCPIKGTRPRGADEAEDQALAADLRGAEKDRAENLMIVDLCRNDLGKVCRFGSVEVTELCGVHPFTFTWQMVSTIRGRLREGLGVVELLRACFPGGSMTGAPKIEAMKIIDRLEPTKRGVFSGAIGVIDYDGAVDLSIVIRTLIKTGSRLSFHVGGAIVADSEPEAEYQETLDKAHGLVLALELAGALARPQA